VEGERCIPYNSQSKRKNLIQTRSLLQTPGIVKFGGARPIIIRCCRIFFVSSEFIIIATTFIGYKHLGQVSGSVPYTFFINLAQVDLCFLKLHLQFVPQIKVFFSDDRKDTDKNIDKIMEQRNHGYSLN
jgi:hypothetical protein